MWLVLSSAEARVMNSKVGVTDGCRAVIGGRSINRTVEDFLICFRDNDSVAITLLLVTAKIRCSLTEL